MTTDWIFGWWNLVFLAPFLLGLIYLGVYAASGVTFGDVDADADMDGDVGFDADSDVDADIDADGEVATHADLHADHDVAVGPHDGGHGHGHGSGTQHQSSSSSSPFAATLSWLGIGVVPLSIVLMVLLLTFGGIGFATNVLARDYFAAAWQPIVISLPLALLGSMAITGGIARGIGRFVPLNESSAHRRHELLGAVGEAVFAIDEETGLVSVRDSSGNLLQVACRIGAGREPIAKGSRVKLVAYHAPRNVFVGMKANVQNSNPAGAAQAPAHAK